MHIPTTKPPLKTYLSRLIHVLKIFICRAVTFPLFVNIRTQRVGLPSTFTKQEWRRRAELEHKGHNYYHAVTCFLANQIKPSTCHNIVIMPTPNPTPTAAQLLLTMPSQAKLIMALIMGWITHQSGLHNWPLVEARKTIVAK